MNIGFVSTWMERGAAYVTKAYVESLKKTNNVFVYARGGESFAKDDSNWDLPYVTWGYRLSGVEIEFKHMKKWIEENKLDIIFFNEQKTVDILYHIKKEFPNVILGAYIDYYKENTVKEFELYDFLICNTKRHYSVFENHPQVYYVPWGTDTSVFKPQKKPMNNDKITFFHSVGMSKRKGTDTLLKVFTNNDIYKKSNLIVHSQLDFEKEFNFTKNDLEKFNIEVIEKTVTAPGLYHLGDVYVYPTTLDGLGLTLYEALSCGLPVITTDNGPMNEVINSNNGYLVNVEKYYSRADGYYWPLSIVNEQSLLAALEYYVDNADSIETFSTIASEDAQKRWDWKDRTEQINSIFQNAKLIVTEINEEEFVKVKKQKLNNLFNTIYQLAPARVRHYINKK